jgi:hypothetical protein
LEGFEPPQHNIVPIYETLQILASTQHIVVVLPTATQHMLCKNRVNKLQLVKTVAICKNGVNFFRGGFVLFAVEFKFFFCFTGCLKRCYF